MDRQANSVFHFAVETILEQHACFTILILNESSQSLYPDGNAVEIDEYEAK